MTQLSKKIRDDAIQCAIARIFHSQNGRPLDGITIDDLLLALRQVCFDKMASHMNQGYTISALEWQILKSAIDDASNKIQKLEADLDSIK